MRAGHPMLLSPFRGQETSHIAEPTSSKTGLSFTYRNRFTFDHPLRAEDFASLARVLLHCSKRLPNN